MRSCARVVAHRKPAVKQHTAITPARNQGRLRTSHASNSMGGNTAHHANGGSAACC